MTSPDILRLRSQHPWGEAGEPFVRETDEFLRALCESKIPESAEAVRYRGGDKAMMAYIEVESFRPFLRPSAKISPEACNDLSIALTGLRLALPWSEAERTWVRETQLLDDSLDDRPEIVAAGVHTTIDYRAMFDRWLAWRRQEGEYADQGSLELAKEKAREIISLVDPEAKLTDLYMRRPGEHKNVELDG